MFMKKMTYTDFDGNERTEDFYFNLSEAELARFELSETGGLSKLIEKISQEKDAKKMWDLMEEIVYMSCGAKSLDGRRFDKSPEAKRNFTETAAYSDFILELATDAKLATDFVNGLVKGSKIVPGKIAPANPELKLVETTSATE